MLENDSLILPDCLWRIFAYIWQEFINFFLIELDYNFNWIFSLHIQGPFFPPDYVPLPKNVYMKYNGERINLAPKSEEVMVMYAAMLRTDYVTDPKGTVHD